MKADRTIMRLALPPALAFAFVAVLSTPLAASSALAEQPAGPLVGGSAHTSVLAPAPAAGNAKVGIGAVAFTEQVVISDGHLRTPVLLADDSVTASATVAGASTGAGCTAQLIAGVPAWLDCPISVAPGSAPRVVVTLSDGRTATKSIAVT